MDALKVWRMARECEGGFVVDGVTVSFDLAAALRSYPEPRLEAGKMVFAKGPSPRRRLVAVDAAARLEVV